jgi:hypothetical protein
VAERTVVEARGGAGRCAWCHDALAGPTTSCEGCGTPLHDECWSLGAGCPTLGCARSGARAAPSPSRPTWRVTGLAALGVLTLALTAFVVKTMPRSAPPAPAPALALPQDLPDEPSPADVAVGAARERARARLRYLSPDRPNDVTLASLSDPVVAGLAEGNVAWREGRWARAAVAYGSAVDADLARQGIYFLEGELVVCPSPADARATTLPLLEAQALSSLYAGLDAVASRAATRALSLARALNLESVNGRLVRAFTIEGWQPGQYPGSWELAQARALADAAGRRRIDAVERWRERP